MRYQYCQDQVLEQIMWVPQYRKPCVQILGSCLSVNTEGFLSVLFSSSKLPACSPICCLPYVYERQAKAGGLVQAEMLFHGWWLWALHRSKKPDLPTLQAPERKQWRALGKAVGGPWKMQSWPIPLLWSAFHFCLFSFLRERNALQGQFLKFSTVSSP